MVSDMQICCVDIVGNGFVRSADTRQTFRAVADIRLTQVCMTVNVRGTTPRIIDNNKRKPGGRKTHAPTRPSCVKNTICFYSIYPARSLRQRLSGPSGLRSRSEQREQTRSVTARRHTIIIHSSLFIIHSSLCECIAFTQSRAAAVCPS